jgi:hypothetical protein
MDGSASGALHIVARERRVLASGPLFGAVHVVPISPKRVERHSTSFCPSFDITRFPVFSLLRSLLIAALHRSSMMRFLSCALEHFRIPVARARSVFPTPMPNRKTLSQQLGSPPVLMCRVEKQTKLLATRRVRHWVMVDA